jgi:hypothetical protein
MVEDLDNDFQSTADDLADAASMHPEHLWKVLAGDHYDLNTCLREAFILLKSFLVVLPTSELLTFQDTVQQQSQPLRDQRLLNPPGAISDRRTAAFAGK